MPEMKYGMFEMTIFYHCFPVACRLASTKPLSDSHGGYDRSSRHIRTYISHWKNETLGSSAPPHYSGPERYLNIGEHTQNFVPGRTKVSVHPGMSKTLKVRNVETLPEVASKITPALALCGLRTVHAVANNI